MRRLLATALTAVTLVAGAAGTATAAPDFDAVLDLDTVLDVSRDNLDSEHGGGVATDLSADPEVLRPLLDRARATGVDPARCAALLHQYWLAVAARNAGIDRPLRNVLFDEKMAGTVHVALGYGFPPLGGSNESAIHWDLVADLRRGGELWADGELIQRDGRWTDAL